MGRRLVLAAVLGCVLISAEAHAAFPGQNGKIAFGGRTDPNGPNAVYSINPNGSGVSQLTGDGNSDPAWSPDGTRIAFVSVRDGAPEIWSMNADGSGETRLTNNTSNDVSPSWTPDGTKILWANAGDGTYDIWQMNADGTGQAKIGGSDTAHDVGPVVSPDGAKIAFQRSNVQLWVMDIDGSNEELLTAGSWPDWSPDGIRLVFSRVEHVPCDEIQVVPVAQIFRMNADGTGTVQLTHSGSSNCLDWTQNILPVWSPDGSRIAFTTFTESLSTDPDPDHQVRLMDTEGNPTGTVPNPPLSVAPDWQPVEHGYPRPKGASPFRASLVPAYIACLSPNRAHGPPLAFGSCNPPAERSGLLTTGTPDANGAPAGMTGSLRLETVPGDPATAADEADVTVQVSITDVRCRAASAACPGGPLSDYEGRLLATANALRITDRLNAPPGPQGGPGTGDARLHLPFSCTATADPAIGSTCTLATTLDAVLPGVITEGNRAIWELGQMQVRDAGPNGTGFESPACPPDCGDGDETLFLRQGVFVP